ncbi:Heat shock protein HSP20/alpha crystallin family [Raphanus sativus]|nr:Heat shock protein HSP20/alpha crystallin family [Raphanus sativus]
MTRTPMCLIGDICCCDHLCGADPENTGQIEQPHPGLIQGPDTAYEYKQLPDGSAYVRLDMPGVPNDDFTTYVETWRVNVVGIAPAVSHDSSGRSYSADAALLDTPAGTFPTPRLRSHVQNGVMRLFIHPV